MNSEKDRECADYFRSRPKNTGRCFEALWKKWRSYGRAAGKNRAGRRFGRRTPGRSAGLPEKYIMGMTGFVFSVSEFEAGAAENTVCAGRY